jgi:hypothetical protein
MPKISMKHSSTDRQSLVLMPAENAFDQAEGPRWSIAWASHDGRC